ncbi:carbohydrate-binding protein [Actinoplanes sp. Pm04-4]|uniref:Carbohydrate-binding protein n=1 Tax=Paractinoplanes pyxinae TaxID=2997416 RepID=A0ABT4BB51_9ACTN|nr:carbohydrate-binding protein [Actinoplanes pyxinae]MCY1143749.1 carbohydrate-binding protein [Actinoplanes pyxinae]
MLRRYLAGLAAVVAFAALLTAGAPRAGAATFAPTNGRLMLLGQSTKAAWDDYTSFAAAPSGGSVYYEVKSGTWVNAGHRDYATFLAQQGKAVQIGVSWKDNPPGYTGGDETTKAARSRAVTAELAAGQHAAQFDNLIAFVNAYPNAKFFLRLDYEVSSFYHCTDASCSSYKNAFAKIRSLVDGRKRQDNVTYVFHPVRGEYEQMYPGDAATDWAGVSIFAHELCMPIRDNGAYLYNGTPPQNYDTSTLQCRNAYLGTDSAGNPAAVWKNWDYDGNVLKMMKFARDHGKPMIVSESGMMNFTDDTDTRGLEPVRGDTWVKRFFGLMNYSGPIPNLSGTYDLSNVIKAAVYINLDFRYGWDGIADGSFDFPVGSTWFADGRLSQYTAARTSFCQGLADRGFATTCGTATNPPPTTPTNPPTTPPTTPPASGRDAFATIEAESRNAQSGTTVTAGRLSSLNNGDWARYDGLAFGGRTPNQVVFRYSSARPTTQAFTLEFRAGSAAGPVIAAPGLLGTGSVTAYKEIAFNLGRLPAGTTSVTVVARANDSAEVLDLDWFRFN